ncbi:MAG: twin-arginine translocation signal domain-containing protein [Deltaproteobacteria bacterium]|nr:twin-arginine translocation signal domain-containing protein [Deltaproteobacteria bacterium]
MTSRRDFLELAGAAAVGIIVAPTLVSADSRQPPKTPAIATGGHKVRDLPFQASKLKGISAAMITSHHDNNYASAVKNLNKVELELAKVTKDTPGFQVAALRERELTYTNSMILHEAYFGNLGGDGKLGGALDKRLAAQFGSTARWEELFRATALSLGGGSGWVILDLNFATGDLRIYGAGGHSQSVAFGQPLLALDMFEHAYAMDYGAAHGKYVDAFFQNVSWSEVEKRLSRGDKALQGMS